MSDEGKEREELVFKLGNMLVCSLIVMGREGIKEEKLKEYKKATEQIRQLIEHYFKLVIVKHHSGDEVGIDSQQQPEIDEKYVEEKTQELIEIISKVKIEEAMSFVKSVISDVRGGGK